MKLYIGGAYQGQDELAARENPGARVVYDFHKRVRDVVHSGNDAREYASAFILENPDAIVTADEIGMGIVPIDAGDRAWREAVGRAMCLLAQASESVTRVTCGIGVRIK